MSLVVYSMWVKASGRTWKLPRWLLTLYGYAKNLPVGFFAYPYTLVYHSFIAVTTLKFMASKGHQNKRGIPELYEVVKRRYTLMLTPIATSRLDAIASSLGLSRSELVERVGRGIYPISIPPANTSTTALDAEASEELGKPLAS